MVTYQNKDVNLKTVYSIEYIDNKKDLEYVNSGRCDKGEPWDRYKRKESDNADEAFSWYMVMFVRNDLYDVKIFEQTMLNGELVKEEYIEPAQTTRWSISNAVNRDMEKKIESLQETNSILMESIEKYEAFIKKYNAEKMFKEFVA